MKPRGENLYLHLDGDSFFVACELSLRPELLGKPVIVGGDRGIAVAMSREAKKLGVTRGMPVFRIKKLFPTVVILNHNFKLYQSIAEKMQEILATYFSVIEVYSIDECFALVQPHEVGYFGSEEKLVNALKKEIEQKLKVTYSIGIARTKSLSKLASKLEKPNGVVILLDTEAEKSALKKTSIDDVWGIGRRTVPALRKLGINIAYDLVEYPAEKIAQQFSRPLSILQRELSGEPIMQVENDVDPRAQKSIQSTSTFHPSSSDPKVIMREISKQAENATRHARALELVTNRVSFFIKNTKFKYFFGEAKLESYTSDPGEILKSIESSLQKLLKNQDIIRSTGVILHNLIREEKVSEDLFGTKQKSFKKIAVEKTADKLRAKYGANIITRASSIK